MDSCADEEEETVWPHPSAAQQDYDIQTGRQGGHARSMCIGSRRSASYLKKHCPNTAATNKKS